MRNRRERGKGDSSPKTKERTNEKENDGVGMGCTFLVEVARNTLPFPRLNIILFSNGTDTRTRSGIRDLFVHLMLLLPLMLVVGLGSIEVRGYESPHDAHRHHQRDRAIQQNRIPEHPGKKKKDDQ